MTRTHPRYQIGGHDRSDIGILGFSFGASMRLLALLKLNAHIKINPVLLFGAYYNLNDTIRAVSEQSLKAPAYDEDWDTYIWLRAVAAYKNMNRAPLDNGAMPPSSIFWTVTVKKIPST